jgi:hypothetical protein
MAEMPALPASVAVLAQLSDEKSRNILVGSILLIVILLIFFGGVVFYRRWMQDEGDTSGEGFTLSDLRRLHKEGKMTTEEYEKAKAILIGSVKAAAAAAEQKAKEGPRTGPHGFDVLPPDK